MNITIEGYRTQSKKFKALLSESVEFYASKLMRRDLANNIELDIVVIKDLLKKENVHGYCWISGGNEYKPREFTIEICGSDVLGTILMTLAHEMVHIKQYARGELRYNNDFTLWKGEKLPKPSVIPVDAQPWEQEAHELEEDLFLDLITTTKIIDTYIKK